MKRIAKWICLSPLRPRPSKLTCPPTESVVVTDSDHVIPFENPQAIADATRSVIEQVRAPVSGSSCLAKHGLILGAICPPS
jgi:hypothetical protein